jgi:hypothetical protein
VAAVSASDTTKQYRTLPKLTYIAELDLGLGQLQARMGQRLRTAAFGDFAEWLLVADGGQSSASAFDPELTARMLRSSH